MESNVKRASSGLPPLIAGALGAGTAFSAVFFGLPLLGAIEHGSGARIGIAIFAALFLGSVAAVVARGRSITALAEAALAIDLDPALITHRNRRSRARWAGAATAVIGFGLTYLAFDQWLDAEPSGLDLTLLSLLWLGVAAVAWRVLDPGRFIEKEEAHVLDASRNRDGAVTVVSDRELAQTVAAVRAHRRRSMLATAGSLFAAIVTIGVLGYAMAIFDVGGGRLWALVLAAGVAVGVVCSRALSPKTALEDLDS